MTGDMKKAKQPAPEPGTREAPPPSIPTEDRSPCPETKAQLIERPEVSYDFTHTDRTRLRMVALDYALRGGELMRSRVASGEEILQAAEQIERWIAEPAAKAKS